ncbi:Na/Pi symporter [Caldimonas tepidiphila]|uniref:Na/Pi symporter n=1 Tax=Caldimonas tepidiphila TaxID=2315841 RepID=UPI000E5AE891|nr:Na/Pi symporter [Caldimonas tepidiphila]
MDAFRWGVGVAAAVLLFLYALEGFSREVQDRGGERLRRWLTRATANRWKGFLLGAGATALVQSSSAVSSLVVALVHAGTLGFGNSLGVLLGAKVGTTVTAWLVSFKLTGIGPFVIVLGALVSALGGRWIGRPLFYFGFVFFSLDLIGLALAPLKDSALWQAWMTQAAEPLLAVAAGMAMTALVQSSSVTVGLAVLLVQQGLMPAPAAIGVALGASVGTTATALIASARMGLQARRAAVANLLFNAVSLLVFLPVLDAFSAAVLTHAGSADLAVAWAHLLFNLAVALVFLPLLGPLQPWIERRFGSPPSPPVLPGSALRL